MAAVGIVGLTIASAANLRTVLLSCRQRCEHYSENTDTFDGLISDLARITTNLKDCEKELSGRHEEVNRGLIKRNLTTVNKKLRVSTKILNELASGPFQEHSGPSCVHFVRLGGQIISANRIQEKLNKVSANFERVDNLLGPITTLLGVSELLRTQAEIQSFNCISSVPVLSHQEVLDFEGKDENGNLTPEAQLKKHLLDEQSEKVTAAAGDAPGRHAKVPSAQGMAGVGKTVALRGLGADKDIQKAFDEIHYITLGRDATADTVMSELARIVRMSRGERESSTVLNCKDVGEAVLQTRKWFSGRKCLFLIDDMWKTESSDYGYLPALRQLLSSSGGSRIAITTRDRSIASEAGQAVDFGPRDAETSRQIFLRHFGIDHSDNFFVRASRSESLKKTLGICDGLPLALSIAGRGARAFKDGGWSVEDALDDYAKRLERRRSDLLDKPSPGYGRGDKSLTLRAAIETSLDFLDSRSMAAGVTNDGSIADMYRKLGVLKAQAWAPVSMLSRLWHVSREDTKRIMGQLCTMSLAKAEDCVYPVIRTNESRLEGGLRIHDLQLEYCRLHCTEIKSWHGKLLDGYLEPTEETRIQGSTDEDATVGKDPRPWWSESVAEDNYLHENIARHLVNAGKHDELQALVLDARWKKLRLVIGGIAALENDFAELARMQGSGVASTVGYAAESNDVEFRVILNALRCSWQYVVRNERELALQIGARLFKVQKSSAAARQLVRSALQHSEKPFAEARYGFLPDAGSGLVNEVHLDRICKCLAYSECGKYIAALVGGDVVVVEADTLAEKFHFNSHRGRVLSVCFLPRSSKVVSGFDNGTVGVWNLSKPNDDALTLGQNATAVTSVCASADGLRVAAGYEDGAVHLWNLQEEKIAEEGIERRSKWMSLFFCSAGDTDTTEDAGSARYKCMVLQGHTGKVNCVCFSPDGVLLASGSNDWTVQLWNCYTGKYAGVTFEGHKGVVSCIGFSPDGERVASGSDDGYIRLWRADTGVPVGIVICGHRGVVNSVAFSTDGTRIVSASSDMNVRLWSAKTGTAIGAALSGHTDSVTSAVFSPDGAHVASASNDRTLRIWEPEKAEGSWAMCAGWSMQIQCVAFSADGARVAVGYENGGIWVWSTQSGRSLRGPLEGHTHCVTHLAFSPDGSLLASGSLDKTVRLWNLGTGGAGSGALKGLNMLVHGLSFSRDGEKLLLSTCAVQRFSRFPLRDVPSSGRLWLSYHCRVGTTKVLSDAEARAAIDAIKSQSRLVAPSETAIAYYDIDGAVKIKCHESDVCLASRLPLAYIRNPQGKVVFGTARIVFETSWMHIADRDEFVAVLENGRPVCLKLHL